MWALALIFVAAAAAAPLNEPAVCGAGSLPSGFHLAGFGREVRPQTYEANSEWEFVADTSAIAQHCRTEQERQSIAKRARWALLGGDPETNACCIRLDGVETEDERRGQVYCKYVGHKPRVEAAAQDPIMCAAGDFPPAYRIVGVARRENKVWTFEPNELGRQRSGHVDRAQRTLAGERSANCCLKKDDVEMTKKINENLNLDRMSKAERAKVSTPKRERAGSTTVKRAATKRAARRARSRGSTSSGVRPGIRSAEVRGSCFRTTPNAALSLVELRTRRTSGSVRFA